MVQADTYLEDCDVEDHLSEKSLKKMVINTIKVAKRQGSRNYQLIRKYMTPEPQSTILHQDTFIPNYLDFNDDIALYTKSTLNQPKNTKI